MLGEKQKRNPYWQVIRGVCILAVISIHCPNALLLEHNSVQFWLYFFIRQATNFPVAVFLFMAGYFSKIERWKEKPSEELWFRTKRLFLPYVCWSAVYIIVKCLFESRMSIKVIAADLLLGRAATPFYYVIVLIQLTCLIPLLCRTISLAKKCVLVFLCDLSPIALIILYVCASKTNTIPWYCNTLFPVWIVFFFLGIACKMNSKGCLSFMRIMGKWWIVILCFAANFLEAVYWLDDVPRLATSQNRFGAYLFSLSLIAFVYNHSKKDDETTNTHFSCEWLRWIGDNSFALFWIHCLILEFVKRFAGIIMHEDLWILQYSMCFIATIVISVICIVVLKFLARRTGLDRYSYIIGF